VFLMLVGIAAFVFAWLHITQQLVGKEMAVRNASQCPAVRYITLTTCDARPLAIFQETTSMNFWHGLRMLAHERRLYRGVAAIFHRRFSLFTPGKHAVQ